MIYILLSITCSVTVGILLKLAKRYRIDLIQAITFNYLMAIALSLFFFKPNLQAIYNAPMALYLTLGILLPIVFLLLAISIKKHGIVKTDIAQRLSLLIPLLAAWILFKENIGFVKLGGFVLGISAVFLILQRKNTANDSANAWYLAFVFVGFGVIDVLFKQVARTINIPYTTSLFFIFSIAFILSIVYVIYLFIRKQSKFQFVNFICGLILGFFNFLNILFYLKAHKVFAEHPSTVFASMNLGVIVIGSMVGFFIFKESLSKLNFLGIFLAIAAVALITIAQLYAI